MVLPPACAAPGVNASTGLGGCPGYDTQHGLPWRGWQARGARLRSEYSRMLCIDSRGRSPVVHQCQRYFSAEGRENDQLANQCPPALDRCLGAATGWRCSSDLQGAAYTCPGGQASMHFCSGGKNRRCVNPLGELLATSTPWSQAKGLMCKS